MSLEKEVRKTKKKLQTLEIEVKISELELEKKFNLGNKTYHGDYSKTRSVDIRTSSDESDLLVLSRNLDNEINVYRPLPDLNVQPFWGINMETNKEGWAGLQTSTIGIGYNRLFIVTHAYMQIESPEDVNACKSFLNIYDFKGNLLHKKNIDKELGTIYGKEIFGGPSVVYKNNSLIVHTAAKYVCFDRDGNKKWDFTKSKNNEKFRSLYHPEMTEDAIYAHYMFEDGNTYKVAKLDYDGQILWESPGAHSFGPFIYKDLFIFYESKNLVALDKDGKREWKYTLDKGKFYSNVVLHKDKILVLIDPNPKNSIKIYGYDETVVHDFLSIDAITGKTVWKDQLILPGKYSFASSINNKIYANTSDENDKYESTYEYIFTETGISEGWRRKLPIAIHYSEIAMRNNLMAYNAGILSTLKEPYTTVLLDMEKIRKNSPPPLKISEDTYALIKKCDRQPLIIECDKELLD